MTKCMSSLVGDQVWHILGLPLPRTLFEDAVEESINIAQPSILRI